MLHLQKTCRRAQMEEQHVYSANANVSAKQLCEARWADIRGNVNEC